MAKSTRDKLDKLRGDLSRSEWLRHVITQEIEGMHEWIEKLPEATAPVPDARKSGGMKIVRDYSDDPAMTGKITHRHRFERREQIGHQMRGTLQVPVYRYECGSPTCDEYQERP